MTISIAPPKTQLPGKPLGHRMAIVFIRCEKPADLAPVRAVHQAAFAQEDQPGAVPAEVGLVDDLRADDGWIPELSMVALEHDGSVVGHVVCTRATVGAVPALGLGPLGVLPEYQGRGIGGALMHAVLGGADALGEPMVALLGHVEYYPRFGFRPASELGVVPPAPEWGEHFQVRTLSAYVPSMRGAFSYAEPFSRL